MFDLKRHLINTINKSKCERVIICFNNELESGEVTFELIGMFWEDNKFIYDSLESFNNVYVFSEVLDYLLNNNMFAYFKVVNY